VRLKASWTAWLNLPHSLTVPPPVTAKHRVVKFQEMRLSKGYMAMDGKDFEKRKVLWPEWKYYWHEKYRQPVKYVGRTDDRSLACYVRKPTDPNVIVYS